MTGNLLPSLNYNALFPYYINRNILTKKLKSIKGREYCSSMMLKILSF